MDRVVRDRLWRARVTAWLLAGFAGIAVLLAAIDKIGLLDDKPEFILHTGDLTHGAQPAEFDTLDQLLQGARRDIFNVPGGNLAQIAGRSAQLSPQLRFPRSELRRQRARERWDRPLL